MSCYSHTPLSIIFNEKGTFKEESLNFKIDVFGNGELIVFALLGDLVKNGLTLSVGGIHKVFKYFSKSVEFDGLLVDFLVD